MKTPDNEYVINADYIPCGNLFAKIVVTGAERCSAIELWEPQEGITGRFLQWFGTDVFDGTIDEARGYIADLATYHGNLLSVADCLALIGGDA